MIIYLHGFNSSPQSVKARQLGQYMSDLGLQDLYACPTLPPNGDQAIAIVEAIMAIHSGAFFTFVGSSLGGFYATCLAEKHSAQAVLINPSIAPQNSLRAHLGEQCNLHTGEKYLLSEAHLGMWKKLMVPAITPSRYLLLVETGDELLDYREAVARYAGARQVVVQGGDHTLQSFVQHIPTILDFAELMP